MSPLLSPTAATPRLAPPLISTTIECSLDVGKGSITPTVDVEVGDSLTGSAVVTGAEGTVTVTHGWDTPDGIKETTSATYVTDEAGAYRYRQTVEDDYCTKVGEWSDPVTVTEPVQTGPNADMNGLRFDNAGRETVLSRSVPAGPSSWTYSAWLKPTPSTIDSNYVYEQHFSEIQVQHLSIKTTDF